jgi:hypothetical protein
MLAVAYLEAEGNKESFVFVPWVYNKQSHSESPCIAQHIHHLLEHFSPPSHDSAKRRLHPLSIVFRRVILDFLPPAS